MQVLPLQNQISTMDNQTLPLNVTSEVQFFSMQIDDLDLLISITILLFTILLTVLSTIFGRFLSWSLRSSTRVHPFSTLKINRIQLIYLQSLFHSFDLIDNIRSLFMPVEKKYQNYSWCYGIKACLVLGFIWLQILSFDNPTNYILLASFFFIISGFLAINRFNHRTLLDLGIFLLDRWIQLISLIVATLCLSTLVGKIQKFQPCECGFRTWFKHLLMISNLWNNESTCLSHLVYPSLLFQCYIILCIIQCLLLYRKRNIAVIFTILLLLSSITTKFFLDYKVFTVYFIQYQTLSSNWLLLVQAFFLSAFLPNLPYSTLTSLIDVVIFLISVFLAISLGTFDKAFQPLVDFSSTLIQALIIYLVVKAPCKTSLIKQFLSSNFCTVLGRLSYEMFLLAPLVTILNQSTMFNQFQIFTTIIMQTFLLSIPVYILFRAPVKNLLRLLEKIVSNQEETSSSTILPRISSPQIKLKSFSILNLN